MATDPLWTDVKLLFLMQGTNGSSALPDEKGHAINNFGVMIDTSVADPFGLSTGVGYFNGYGIRVTYPGSSELSPSTGDFTVELWVYQTTQNNSVVLISDDTDGYGWCLEMDTTWTSLSGHCNGVAYSANAPGIPLNTWTHVAGVRNGDVFTVYINGVGGLGVTQSGPVNVSNSASVIIGREASTWSRLFRGYMSNVRMTRAARYAANFTPPTEAFPNTGDTVVSGVASLPIQVQVMAIAYGSAALPMDVRTGPSGATSLPIDVRTGASGAAALAVALSVVPPALLDGTQSPCIGVGSSAAIWATIVRVAGIDVSDQVIGSIRIEAEEGAARIAELTLRPPTGSTLSLAGWTGLSVEIDVADNSTGTPRYPLRRFTGVIDKPTLNQSDRTLSLRCTDDLQGRLNGMSAVSITSLIGGYSSPAVFDAAAIGWSLAQDRLSTIPASLDISPYGALRLTPWQSKSVPDLTLDAQILGDQSVAPQIADRSSLVNEVVVSFDYRFPRVKAECHRVSFNCVQMINFAQYQIESRAFMQRAQVESAIQSAGGTIESITYVPLPDENIPVGETGYWTPGPYDATLCMGFTADVSFDYAQTTEEQHRISVRNELSIAAVGLRSSTLSGAMVGEYPDLVATETGIKLYKASVTRIPPANVSAVSVGYTTSAETTLTPETDRTAANAAMETLIAIAKTRIAAGHRYNRVSAVAPFIPAIDLDKTIKIDAGGVLAKGKCTRTVDVLSLDTGSATTEFSIALSALAGYGIVHDGDATTAPAGTEAASAMLTGLPIVTFNSGPTEDLVISITFPGVEEYERANAIHVIPSVIRAPIGEDLFTITL